MLSNYTELKTAIKHRINRDDMDADIPTFIYLAEKMMNKRVRCRAMEKRATLVTNPLKTNPEYYPTPAGYVEMRNLLLDGNRENVVRLSTPTVIAKRNTKAIGMPTHYVVFGKELKLWPIPAAVYTMEMIYYREIENLSAENETNELLADAPDLYFYACLYNAYLHINHDGEVAKYKGLYGMALEEFNLAEQEAIHSGSGEAVSMGVIE